MPCIIIQPPGGFLPSGMILSSAFTITSSASTVTGWTADTAGYPGSVVLSNGLLAQGSKAGATVSASCLVANSYFISGNVTVYLQVNEVTVATSAATPIPASGNATIPVSGTADLTIGDVVTVQASGGSGSNIKMQPTSSYVRIT